MIRDTLLVIDDSQLDLAILNEIFKSLFRVECAADARRGLSYLHRNHQRVCAVLLDICLERRGEGFTVLHQIQGNQDTTHIPVILITTDANEKDVRASVERGAVDFLVKPVDPRTVQERVCGVVRGAWPPQSTILDRRGEPGGGQEPSEGQDRERDRWQIWLEKLEVLCRLRPVIDVAACRQVGAITQRLAECWARRNPEEGLTQEQARWIGIAAMFCDVGLLGIPDSVAEAGEDQTGPEGQLYYQHTRLGETLFQGEKGEPLARYAGEIARWHHKNADGSGYPPEGDGNVVPLSARLTRAALRLQHYLRYYQGCADGWERTVRALRSESGIILDPEVFRMIEEAGEKLGAAPHISIDREEGGPI